MSQYQFGNIDDEDEQDKALVADIEEGAKEPEKQSPTTLYDAMREELNTPAKPEETTIKLPVKFRPNFEVEFNVVLGYDKVERWTKLSSNKKSEVDSRKLSLMIITNTCVGIHFKGTEMVDPETQESLTFRSDYMKKTTKRLDPVGVITWLYGEQNDGEILQIAQAVSKAAGYEEIDFDDLTGDESDPLA